MTTGKLIQKKRKELGLKQKELAARTGYTSTSSICKIEADLVDLPQRKIKIFSKVLGIPIASFFPNVPSGSRREGTFSIPLITKNLPKPEVNGKENLSEDLPNFRKIDILDIIAKGYDRKKLMAAKVKGDSMIGENLFDGDLVIFSQGCIDQEGIYVFQYVSEIMVKRLVFDPLKKTVDIISANSHYPIRTVDADSVKILGKVIGWIHKAI